MANYDVSPITHQVQHLTVMSLELHARSRRDLEPDPEFDPICALFYCLTSDAPLPDQQGSVQLMGVLVVDQEHCSSERGQRHLLLVVLLLLLFLTMLFIAALCRFQSYSAPAGQVGRLRATGDVRYQ